MLNRYTACMIAPSAPLRLKKGAEADIQKGFPWIYAGDMTESSELLHLPSGSLVSIENAKGKKLGLGTYNAKSPIACRVLTLGDDKIDQNFFKKRFENALSRRSKIGVPF